MKNKIKRILGFLIALSPVIPLVSCEFGIIQGLISYLILISIFAIVGVGLHLFLETP
jgi:hypothetical protein